MKATAVQKGEMFGSWKAIGPAYRRKLGAGSRYYVRCICTLCSKTKKSIQFDSLRGGMSLSCGCQRGRNSKGNGHGRHKKTHGMSESREYAIFMAIHQRCENPKDPSYATHGGKGLRVCKRWTKFEDFLADVGPMPAGHYLGRKESVLGFTPTNAAWMPRKARAE